MKPELHATVQEMVTSGNMMDQQIMFLSEKELKPQVISIKVKESKQEEMKMT